MNVRTRIVKVAAAVTLSVTALGIAATAPAGAATNRVPASVAGDPSQWLSRKVNEYEGQHRKVNEYEGQHRKVNEYEGQH